MSAVTKREVTEGMANNGRHSSLTNSRAEIIVLIEQMREELLEQKWMEKDGSFGWDAMVKLCSLLAEEVYNDLPSEAYEAYKNRFINLNNIQHSMFSNHHSRIFPTLSIYRKFKGSKTKTPNCEADHMQRLLSFYQSKPSTAPSILPTVEHLCSLSKRDMAENSGLTKNGNSVFKTDQAAREALLDDAFYNGYKSMVKELVNKRKENTVQAPKINFYAYKLSDIQDKVKPADYMGHRYIALPADLKKMEQNEFGGGATITEGKTTCNMFDNNNHHQYETVSPMKCYRKDSGVVDCSFLSIDSSVRNGEEMDASCFNPLTALNDNESQLTISNDVAVIKNQQKEFESLSDSRDGAAACQAAIDAYLLVDSDEEISDTNVDKSESDETFQVAAYRPPSSYIELSRRQANLLLLKLKQYGMIEEARARDSTFYKFRSDLKMEEDLYYRAVVMGYRLYQRLHNDQSASDTKYVTYARSRENCRQIIRGKEILKILSTQEKNLIEALKTADYLLKYNIIRDALKNTDRGRFYGDRKHFYAFNVDFEQLKTSITIMQFLSDDFSYYKILKSPDCSFTPKYEDFLNEDGSTTWAALLHPDAPYRLISRKVKADRIGYGMVIRGNSPCFISNVDPDGPAGKYGIKIGQYILEINKKLTMGYSWSSLEEILWANKGWVELIVLEKNEEPNGNKVVKNDIEYRLWFKNNFGSFPIWNEDKSARIVDPEECEKALLRNHVLMKKSNQMFFCDYWKRHL